MTEYLVFTVYVPIETPNISHSTSPYRVVVKDKIEEAAKVIAEQLPEGWEYEWQAKIPDD
jgi:hypothetical protein